LRFAFPWLCDSLFDRAESRRVRQDSNPWRFRPLVRNLVSNMEE
jgi:hypothetical protein